MQMLLKSVAERGTYDEADFTHRLDDELLPQLSADPFSGPGGYTNHSFRQVWQTRVTVLPRRSGVHRPLHAAPRLLHPFRR
jgi:hypothetical protein